MYTPPHLVLGDGDHPVICLHGLLGDHRAFEPIWRLVDRRHFTYAFMDARGYGAARGVAGDYTVGEFAEDAIRIADAHGWQRFSLVGHSLGGMAAQRVLAAVGDRVRSVVGITPVAASGAEFDAAGWELFTRAVRDVDGRRQVLRMLTAGRLTDTWIDSTAHDSLASIDQAAMAGYLKSHSTDDFHGDIAGNPTPVLVVLGEHDPAVTAELISATWTGWYPNIDIEIIGNSGHYPVNEVPIGLVSSVENFLRRQ
jgi:pimeloyl-ACP methyl ester carboxylesterase